MSKKTTSSKSGTTHVVPSGKGWSVKRGGQDKPISNHRTKANAEAAGRKASRSAGTELKIHNRDGKISRSDSHGNDPRNVPG